MAWLLWCLEMSAHFPGQTLKVIVMRWPAPFAGEPGGRRVGNGLGLCCRHPTTEGRFGRKRGLFWHGPATGGMEHACQGAFRRQGGIVIGQALI